MLWKVRLINIIGLISYTSREKSTSHNFLGAVKKVDLYNGSVFII